MYEHLHNGTAYQSIRLNFQLWADTTIQPYLSAKSNLRQLAFIGAIVDDKDRLFTPDLQSFAIAARLMAENGTPLHEKFNVLGYNFLPPMSNNFKQAAMYDHEGQKADVAILFAIPKYGDKDGPILRKTPFGNHMDIEVLDAYSQSRDMHAMCLGNDVDGFWPDMIRLSSAKYAITIGGHQNEISSQDFRAVHGCKVIKPSGQEAAHHKIHDDSIGIIEIL